MAKKPYKTDEERKNKMVGVRLTDDQHAYLEMLIEQGKAKNVSSAIQYLLLKQITIFPQG